jgi:nicotinamidase-related amidase
MGMLENLLREIPGLSDDDREAFRKMWGARSQSTWGLGDRPAVLVVDMTRAFVEDAYPSGWAATGYPCAAAIARLLDVARPLGLPVIYTRSEPLLLAGEVGAWLRGREGPSMFPFDGPPEVHEIVDVLKPHPSDYVYAKPKPSAFFASQLPSILTYLGIDTLVVTGMTTSGCVRATVNDAFSLNYRVVVPVECVADRSQLSHQVELLDMGAKYADLVALDTLLEELTAAP